MKHRPNLTALALQTATGPAMVLDRSLRIVAATPAVEQLWGDALPVGESAPALLCGERPKRPFAEALAAGQMVEAVLPRRRSGRGKDPAPARRGPAVPEQVRVRAMPIIEPSLAGEEARTAGWLLTFELQASHDDEVVEFGGMWTRSPRMKHLFDLITRAAAEDVTVLVRGETGTGKELVSRAIHDHSPRRKGPFRAINCAALPPNLLESELFGHARGAFTGAVRDTPGHIQLADKGTLFLDEVAELPLELQAKLLRVVETHTVIPVGAREALPVDVRIVSATHRALRKEVEAGRFRADLMYRLRVIPLFLPPLRERAEDVAPLCERFCDELNRSSRRRQVLELSPAAKHALANYAWPGNVRELRNALAYAHVMGDGPILQVADLPPEITQSGASGSALLEPGELEATPAVGAEVLPTHSQLESARIARALQQVGGNREQAAKMLGLSRVTLWRHMRALGLH